MMAGYAINDMEPIAVFESFGFWAGGCSWIGTPDGADLGPDAHVALGELGEDDFIDAICGPIAEETTIDVCEVYTGKSYGLVPSFLPSVRQMMKPGLLVDVDADGDLDVLGRERIYINVAGE